MKIAGVWVGDAAEAGVSVAAAGGWVGVSGGPGAGVEVGTGGGGMAVMVGDGAIGFNAV